MANKEYRGPFRKDTSNSKHDKIAFSPYIENILDNLATALRRNEIHIFFSF